LLSVTRPQMVKVIQNPTNGSPKESSTFASSSEVTQITIDVAESNIDKYGITTGSQSDNITIESNSRQYEKAGSQEFT